MNFEEALKDELDQISAINKKVFPLVAPEGTKAPFVVYKMESTKYAKTLNGTLDKAEGVYTLHVLTSDYAQLKLLSESIKDKLLSFLGRYISTNGSGPLIKNVTVEFLSDSYESTVGLLMATIKLHVNY